MILPPRDLEPRLKADIIIIKAPNGWLIRETARDPGYATPVIAVFNSINDLAAFITTYYTEHK